MYCANRGMPSNGNMKPDNRIDGSKTKHHHLHGLKLRVGGRGNQQSQREVGGDERGAAR